MSVITPREWDALVAIRDMLEEGVTPTLDAIGGRCGCAVSAAYKMTRHLTLLGVIDRTSVGNQTETRLTELGERLASEPRPTLSDRPKSTGRAVVFARADILEAARRVAKRKRGFVSYMEIANELGVSVSTVQQKTKYARQQGDTTFISELRKWTRPARHNGKASMPMVPVAEMERIRHQILREKQMADVITRHPMILEVPPWERARG